MKMKTGHAVESHALWSGVAQDRAEALAIAQGEELTTAMRQTGKSISSKAGRIERESPLFHGTGENPTLF